MKKKCLTILLLSIILNVFSQNRTLDSLNLALKNSKEDSIRVKILSNIGTTQMRIGNYEEAINTCLKAKKLGESINFIRLIGKNYSNIGECYDNLGKNDSAFTYYSKSYDAYNLINNKKGMAGALHNIGLKYSTRGESEKALEHYFKALKINSEIDNKIWMTYNYSMIGSQYSAIGNNPKALENYIKGLTILEKLDDKRTIALYCEKLAILYRKINDLNKALFYAEKGLKINLDLDDKIEIADSYNILFVIYSEKGERVKAKEYTLMALKIYEKLNYPNGMSTCYNNLALGYNAEENFAKALEYFLKSAKISEMTDNEKDLISSYGNLSVTLFKQKKYQEALKYALKSLELAKKLKEVDYLMDCNLLVSEIYEEINDGKSAIKYYKEYVIQKDSMFNEENTKRLVKSEMNFEFEKKSVLAKAEQQKKDAIALEQIKQQKAQRNYFIIGFILILIVAIIVFISYRQKKKANIHITEQKQIAERQKHIIEEKHKEITDSINYAERIQRSFLATKELLDHNLKDYFVFFKPKDIVSGDFYWASKLSNGHFSLVVADSTGHGVPGAIMSLLNVTSLEKAIEHYMNPAEILNHTRQTIIDRLKKDGSEHGGKDGMDCSVLVFDFQNKQLKIAAANNPVWIIRKVDPNELNTTENGTGIKHELIEIKPDKMPVGKSDKENQPFTLHTVGLQEGDTIYALTDGFPDQFGGANGKKFMSKRLKELLLTNADLTMDQQKGLLQTTLKNWVGGLEQVDDICILGIKFNQ